MAKSADSALKLGQARGAAIAACAVQDMAVTEYAARQIKQARKPGNHEYDMEGLKPKHGQVILNNDALAV